MSVNYHIRVVLLSSMMPGDVYKRQPMSVVVNFRSLCGWSVASTAVASIGSIAGLSVFSITVTGVTVLVWKTPPPLVIIPAISTSVGVGVVYPTELIVVLAPVAMSWLIVGRLVMVWSIVIVTPLIRCVPVVSTWSVVVVIPSVHVIATSILAWYWLVLESWWIVKISSWAISCLLYTSRCV